MNDLGTHLVLVREDNHVLASTIREGRTIARAVLRQGRGVGLLCFGTADSHLHVHTTAPPTPALEAARRIESSLKQQLRLPVGFAPAYAEPIRDGRHHRNTVRYVLTQQPHHGLSWDPGREATNLPDLLGLRVLGDYTATNLRRVMPRLQRSSLLSWLGVQRLEPADEPLEMLVSAGLSASCLDSLRGRTPSVIEARTAIVHLAGGRNANTGGSASRRGAAHWRAKRERGQVSVPVCFADLAVCSRIGGAMWRCPMRGANLV